MSRAFTVLWTMQERQTWLQSGASEFGSAFGNSYRSRGVEPGDALYILSCGQGNVWLWGRLVVKSIEDPKQRGDADWARDAVRADPFSFFQSAKNVEAKRFIGFGCFICQSGCL